MVKRIGKRSHSVCSSAQEAPSKQQNAKNETKKVAGSAQRNILPHGCAHVI
jgi:hypothetical protein